jgi:hypothetical protein
MFFSSTDGVELAREELRAAITRFLEECGWEYSSDHPGGIWLYERTLQDGSNYIVDEVTALDLQAALEWQTANGYKPRQKKGRR